MANTKIRQAQIVNDGWVEANEAWSYASATTITVPSGAASKYQKGDKIKLTQTTVKYFYVVSVADTLLTVTGGSDYTVANAAITSPFFSHSDIAIGFPNVFNYTPTLTASGGTAPTFATIVAKFSIVNGVVKAWGNLSNSSGGTAGSGAVTLNVALPVNEGLGISMVGNGVCYSAGVTFLGVFCRASTTVFYMHDGGMANVNAVAFSNAARQLHFDISYPLA